MPSIDIARKHKKPLPEAKAAVERLAQGIVKRFNIEYGWDGDTLNFERAGVNGHISLTKTTVKIHADLSFLMLPIKSAIESEIERHLEREFG